MKLKYTKNDDIAGEVSGNLKIDLSPFTGKWKNTKTDSGQIPKIEMRSEKGQLFMRAFASYGEGLLDWGEVVCTVYTDKVNSDCANAFISRYELDKITVEISANVKLGVLVVQTYSRFLDKSPRYNYYTREFYGPDNG